MGSCQLKQISSEYMRRQAVRVRHQRGMALAVVLVALLLMSIAAVGLVRMVDTGSLVIGNLAFKQSATSSSDQGVEAALTYLQPQLGGTVLYDDKTADGYYATSLSALDISGNLQSNNTRALVDWDGDNCAYAASSTYTTCLKSSAAVSFNDYESRYVIARMCKTTGDPNATTNNCAKPVATSSSASPKRGELKYGEDKRFEATPGPYYRVVVRTKGPRNTVSFTETYIHF